MYKWEHALDIAVQHKTHVDTVIAYRKRFLAMYKKEETSEKFKQFSEGMNVDWETIKNKIRAEKEKEAAANAAQWKN